MLATDTKAFRVVPAVLEWQKQYAAWQHRYKFLVLDGPSRMGKTLFAKSLSPGPASVLELNCSSELAPDLRGFRHGQHTLILFDEIVPHQVLAERKFFQACNAKIQLGCSATNCYAYNVYAYGVQFVLATNKWKSSFGTLQHEDVEWLNANSVYVDVQAPLYIA